MATFSPHPRRTTRYSSIGMSPSPPRQGVARRTRAGGSTQPQSRFSTPARRIGNLPAVKDDESVLSGSGMDVDDESSEVFERGLRTDTVFSKSKEMTVTFYAQLPMEVKQALRNADFYRDAYTGDVDTLTGFAVVASLRTCFVWKYSQALTGTPTCYIFGCPKEAYPPPMATPFHALVPFGTQREPGLIICSNIGQIRFWDSIGMGLAGGDNFSFSLLDLEEGENVTSFVRADSQTFIASTSAGRLFRLLVTSAGGKYHLSVHPFGRPQSSLSRFLPGFFSDPDQQPQRGFISAVAAEELERGASGRLVWALVDLRLQKWNMAIEGWEKLITEEDIGEQTRAAVREHFTSAPESDLELDLELLDLKLQKPGDMVMLVSWAGQEDGTSTDLAPHPRRVYAVVYLRHLPDAFTVTKVQAVPYQSTSSSGAPMHPRIQVVVPEKLLAIQFGDAVTICSQENEYMDRLELKSAMDRTLGLGVVQGESEFLVLTAATMMKTTIDLDEVASFHPEPGRANLIKSTMTKAILYGSLPENPLHFSFPPEIDEEALMSGAEQLSAAILESDTEVVRAHHDLHAQMTGRKERLSFLIKFINDNSALTKMSQRSRQTLAADAEKLYAAHQLWLRHNESLRAGHTDDVLYEAVYRYMNDVGEGHHEDCLRAFLRLRVRDLGGLLPHVAELVRRSSSEMNGKPTETVPQANQVVLTILQSAHSYRAYNLGVYGVVLPMIDPWTSQPEVVEIVNELFNVTTQLVEAHSGDSETAESKKVPRAQLPELASCLFRCIQERLDWLASPSAADETGVERERSLLEDRFRQLRPEALEVLRRNGFANEAFRLAEDYHDFRSLASLCHKGKIYPPEDNPNAARIENYIQKFKEAFTTELYQWYIEHGELRTMFAQSHSEYLDTFFAEHPHPGISWIHDLGRGRYALASQALLTEAEHAPELVSKHLMLSIGKLSHLAQLHEGTKTINQDVLDAFHDGLDFVSVHETLIEDLKSALASVRGRQSLETQVETIAQKKAANLSNRRALYNVFKFLVRQLLQGKALSVEDMAELLSLKDNYERVEDYATALHLLARAENIPSSRRLSVFRNVWRRIYIHDDWNMIRQTTGVSDEELNQRLRSTALYAALQAVAPKRQRPEGYKLPPAEALDVPSEDELALRWPSMSPEEVSAVERDYWRDSRVLQDLDLDAIYQSMEQLVSMDEGASGSS